MFWTTVVCAVEGFLYVVVIVGLGSEFRKYSEFVDFWDSPKLLVIDCSNAEVEGDDISSGLQDKFVDFSMGATLTIG